LTALELSTGKTHEVLSFHLYGDPEQYGAWPYYPAVAPDGARLSYASQCGMDPPQLFTGRVDGSTPDPCNSMRQLSWEPAGIRHSSWGPWDVLATDTVDGRILLYAADGSASALLVAANALAANPSWAPADFTTDCE
jgi:hypothetical protein